MSRRLVAVAAVAAALGLAGCIVEAPPAPAAPAPAATPAAPTRDVLADILASPDLDGVPPGRVPGARATVVVVFASWCSHCRDELAVLGGLVADRPGVRVVGVNYKGHEEYDARGNSAAVRAYVQGSVPWLRVVPAGDRLFGELGSPPKVPTMFVYDASDRLVEVFDRRRRPLPDAGELDQLFRRLGA